MGERTDRLQTGIRDTTLFESPDDAPGVTPGGGSVTVRIVEDAVRKALEPEDSYSNARTEDYNTVRYTFKDQYDIPRVSDITWRVKALADLWKKENGQWPTASEFLGWQTAQTSIYTYASGFSRFDYNFGITADDGTTSYWTNDHIRGLVQNDNILSAAPGGALGFGDKQAELITGRQVFLEADLPAILAGFSPVSGGGSGGGSSGGVGRTPATFDRAQLAEEGTNRWRGLLLEEPTDAEVSSFVSDYITEANAFWMRDAGRLDYDTFITNRIRGQERHTFLYQKKPEFQTEAEYMGGFRQTTAQFGLSRATELREIESGASTGVGLAGFGERVGRSREARTINQGSYSQRFAANMAQSGLGRT